MATSHWRTVHTSCIKGSAQNNKCQLLPSQNSNRASYDPIKYLLERTHFLPLSSQCLCAIMQRRNGHGNSR